MWRPERKAGSERVSLSPEQLAAIVKRLVSPGDYVVCLGAGSITQWAYALPNDLAGAAA